MRGEDLNRSMVMPPLRGSPPHARGRRASADSNRASTSDHPRMRGEDYFWVQSGLVANWITPACAGKTRMRLPKYSHTADHPRMRGEDHLRNVCLPHVEGSPPHARGRQVQQGSRREGPGITPACAGKTCRCPASLPRISDHPRMRGEDRICPTRACWSSGSPPHARGRHLYCQTRVLPFRITPACAGKTRSRRSRKQPHAGSPPHARGRLGEVRGLPDAFRITPACAGKTTPTTSCPARPWDHPRMRGEDSTMRRENSTSTGSPPHARGRHDPRIREASASGIAPACAGKTESARSSERGAHGSPPHARGRHEAGECDEGHLRITPACAGKTGK